MKFIDGNSNIDILIYVIAMVLGLALNFLRNYNKRKAKELKEQKGEEPSFPEVLFEPVFQEQETNYEDSESSELETEEYEAIDTVPKPEVILESVETTDVKTEPIDIPSQEEGQAAFASTTEQLHPDEFDKSEIEISASELYSFIKDSEKQTTEMEEEKSPEEEEFDLGQAVIYSEILNAKYINTGY
jgi:hypothetical protein